MADIRKVVLDTSGLDRLIVSLPANAAKLAGDAARAGERYAKDLFSQPAHGRTYRRGGRVHVASAPGSPPAIDTGTLANSTRAEPVDDLTWRISFATEYAFYLEYGTRDMAARPFAKPTRDAVTDFVKRRMAEIVP
ncbi:MAG: hypothetical protein IRZ10_06420 [Thermoflavifilum sp.]|nr:hypothetical protein [Thermoflavifilum sp.]MCL6514040.1 hypothetical protein [Alicyclobacillus sp.]